MTVESFPHWRELHAERLAEAVGVLGSVAGVRGLVLGGSVARGEHWPLSDIDLFPVWRAGEIDDAAMAASQAKMVDWWAASGRAQTLDVSWLRFDDEEVARAVESGPTFAAEQMKEPRWFHGLDKMFGGRGVADPAGVAAALAQWATELRFHPEVVAARVERWSREVESSRRQAAEAHEEGRAEVATVQLRAAARALRLVVLEGWGERLGSLGREWTAWERMARERGLEDFARALGEVAAAGPDDALARAERAPVWLRERIRLAREARRLVGEPVSEAENARDQLAAFSVLVPRRRDPPFDPWLRIPEPDLGSRLERLDELIARAPRS